MRHTITAIAALTIIACAGEAPPREPVRLERVERTSETGDATSKRVRAAEGNVFVIVHLTRDPAPEERRRWIDSIMEDWDGRTYRPAFANVAWHESEKFGLFGRRGKIRLPEQIRLTFEVPQTAVLRNVTVPHPIALSETPPRILRPDAAPRVVHRVEPYYPEVARFRVIQGLVKLEVLVLPDGSVGGARLIHGPAILGDAAAAAVRQWKYEPHVVDGKAVPALIKVDIDFRLGTETLAAR